MRITSETIDGVPMGGVAGWAVDMMERLGGPGAGLAVALENLFPPLPSEVILPLAGFTASRGEMSLAGAIAWTTLGSVVGALALYLIGAAIGRERMRRLASRVPLVRVSDVDRAEAWFARHGTKAVFLGRMVPIFRSLISVPAGVERMPMVRFLAYTAAGSLIWNTAFVLAGYQLGEGWPRIERYAGMMQYVVVASVLIAAGWFVTARLTTQWRGAAERP